MTILRNIIAMMSVIILAAVWTSANPKPMGSVVNCKEATVRGTALRVGYTIFEGDIVNVGPGGTASIALPDGATVRIFENSQVRLTRITDSVQLVVDHGRAVADGKVKVINSSVVSKAGEGNEDKDKGCEVSSHERKHSAHCHDN